MSATYVIEQITLDYIISGRARSYLEIIKIFRFHGFHPPALEWIRLRIEQIASSYDETINGDQVITYNTPQVKSSA